MPAEAWVALLALVVTIVFTVIGAVWYLSAQLARSKARSEVIDLMRAADISRLNSAMERVENAVAGIAVDRTNFASLERRVSNLERWWDENRRGIGLIRPLEPHQT